MMKTLTKEAYYPHPIEAVWTALTDPQALAEWLMPNNFRAEAGASFRFHVDPMPGFSGITECRVLEVEPPRRLVYSWQPLPKDASAAPPAPMVLRWTLSETARGTLLHLEQEGLESLGFWHRFSMNIGWSRMMKKLLPKVLGRVQGQRFTPGAITKRDYGTSTVPPGYAK